MQYKLVTSSTSGKLCESQDSLGHREKRITIPSRCVTVHPPGQQSFDSDGKNIYGESFRGASTAEVLSRLGSRSLGGGQRKYSKYEFGRASSEQRDPQRV